ncbi:MAG: tetratricopeptide repeat protein [Gammaproteobacteria bacterium]|nr:tetratricopeptide repeat protein [Gammaproteobacteria bacterium]MDH3429221.1 tetratricopeptide repeat protein [Gammaproteobacteria bacterium]MDH3434583.1 tetratricopeptide repeat protein [Gammaproteobacteria bacterium]
MKILSINYWTNLSAELKRRKVYPVIAGYAVVSFILLQIGEITFGPLGFPNWVMVGLIALVVAGFPVTILLAWLFDITPTGIQRDTAAWPRDEAARAKPSIAVLPFVDMSAEQDQGYFCEGVSEEILNALSKIRQLNVAARSSSFQYKSGARDARTMGSELGVKTILEGSVRKAGDRLRITAQLVNAFDGYHLWSKTFDKEVKDVFAIQDEIAACIAESLLETITPTQQSAMRTTSTESVSAYEYYLRGRQFFKRFRKMDIEYARQMFREAINIDADFALAWAGYADCHSFLVMYVDPQARYRDEASMASKRALELNPNLAEAHASRGLACLVCEEFEFAEKEFKKALELNPRLFEAYYYYARTKFHQGELDVAAELFKSAAEVDPEDYQSRCLRVQILRGTGHSDVARAEAKEAVAVIEKHLKWSPDDARAFHLGAGPLVVLGDLDRAKRWLHRAIEIAPDDSVVLYNVACNLATLGEEEKALDYLERAVEQGAVSAAWMRNDEDLASVRDHARYKALLQRVEKR